MILSHMDHDSHLSGYGMTPGDTFYYGLQKGGYIAGQAGRIEDRQPITNPGWRAMVERAKRHRAASAEDCFRSVVETGKMP